MPPPPARRATKGRAPSRRSPPPIPSQLAAGCPHPPARRWRRLLTRVSRSRGLGSGAAGRPKDTGPLGRGGGGVALPPRPGPGSRLRLPPRKAGAAAASSFRFSLEPSFGGSVLRGKHRPLRAPPHAPQGPTTARLLPREPRRPPAPPRQPRGRETPGSPLPPRPCGALSPPSRAPGAARERAGWGLWAGPRQVFVPAARARLATQAAVLQFPGFSRRPRPYPGFPRPFSFAGSHRKTKTIGSAQARKRKRKEQEGWGRREVLGKRFWGGFPGKVSEERVRRGGFAPTTPPEMWGPGAPVGSETSGLLWRKERPEELSARTCGQQSTKFYAVGCFSPPWNTEICRLVRGVEMRRAKPDQGKEGRRWSAGWAGFVSSAGSLQNTPSTFQSMLGFPDLIKKGFMPWSLKAKEKLQGSQF